MYEVARNTLIIYASLAKVQEKTKVELENRIDPDEVAQNCRSFSWPGKAWMFLLPVMWF